MFFNYPNQRIYSIFRIWGTFVGLRVTHWRNPPLGPPKLRRHQLPLKSWFWKSQTKLNFEAAFRVYSPRRVHSQKRHSVANFGCYSNWRDPWNTLTI